MLSSVCSKVRVSILTSLVMAFLVFLQTEPTRGQDASDDFQELKRRLQTQREQVGTKSFTRAIVELGYRGPLEDAAPADPTGGVKWLRSGERIRLDGKWELAEMSGGCIALTAGAGAKFTVDHQTENDQVHSVPSGKHLIVCEGRLVVWGV